MKSTYSKIKLDDILYVIVILDLTFQWFGSSPILQRQYIFIFLGIVLSFVYSKGFFRQPAFGWMMLYFFIVLLNYIMGDIFFNNIETIFYREMVPLFLTSTIMFFYFKSRDQRFFTLLIIAFGIFLIHTTIVSYWANEAFPGLMRYQSNSESAKEVNDILEYFRRIGLSNYGLPHALCIIIPGFVYLSKILRGFYRYFFILLTITAWILSYASGAFTALVLSSLSVVLALLVNPHKSKSTLYKIVIAFVLISPILSNKELQISILESVGSILPENSVGQNKILDLQSSLEYEGAEGDVAERTEKLSSTLEVIADNLVIGTDSELSGGHNALLDRFAYLGLLGIIPLCGFLYCQFVFIKRYTEGPIRYYLYIGFGCGLLMLLLKGLYIWSMWLFLFVLLPGMLCWRVSTNNTQVIKQSNL